MPRDEDAFTERVVQALQATGFDVQREAAVSGKRLDVLATKAKIRKGIEVKLNRRGLLDDIVRAEKLIRLPDVDEMYVCGPKVFVTLDDVGALAGSHGIGVLALTDSGELEWLAPHEPSRAKVRKSLLERSGHTAWSTVLECEVREGTPPGTYRLLISATAKNASRSDHTVPHDVMPA